MINPVNHDPCDQPRLDDDWIRVGLVAGSLSGIAYVFAFFVSPGEAVSRLSALSFAPLLVVGSMGIYRFLRREGDTVAFQLAVLLTAMAGVCFLLMIVVQLTLHKKMLPEHQALDEGPLRQASYLVIRSVDQIQLSFDIAWDVLISSGVIAFGVGMVQRRGVIKFLGALAILGAGGGLTLNLMTFPTPPADKGFIDPGALFFTWYVLTFGTVFILYVQECRKKRKDDTQARSPTENIGR